MWCLIAVTVLGLSACDNRERLRQEIDALSAKKESLEKDVELLQLSNEAANKVLQSYKDDIKVADMLRAGHSARYVLHVSIRQISYSFSLSKQIKDAMNEEYFDLATDRKTYESATTGQNLFDSFRWGSALMHSSLGSWRLQVVSKHIEED